MPGAANVDSRHETASLVCVGSNTEDSSLVVDGVPCDKGQPSSCPLLPDQSPATLHANSALQQKAPRQLRILYLAKFRGAESMPRIVRAFRALGHSVDALDERSIESPEALVELINHRTYDCLMFFEGRINPRTEQERHFPTGEGIAHVLRSVKIPGYTWYFDKVYDFDLNRSRELWMQKVAPLCRVAFVTDGALARHTDWGNWYVLRQGVSCEDVCPIEIPEDERRDVAFLGSIYGERAKELEPVAASLELDIISNAFGQELSRVLRSYKIILGPRYPSVPYYWSVRLYTVLGHGGFFLAPEIEGMREEGFIPGVHYAPLGDDPAADIRHWLERPAEREQIAKAGQDLVLSRFTYKHRVKELTQVIAETLPRQTGDRARGSVRFTPSRKASQPTVRHAPTAGKQDQSRLHESRFPTTHRPVARPAPAKAPSMDPLVSFCCALKNRGPHFRKLLDSLSRNGPSDRFEVVVADFGSDDVDLSELQSNCGLSFSLRPVSVEGAFSRSKGLNAAAAAARGGILFFVDADMVVPPEFPAIVRSKTARGRTYFPVCYSLDRGAEPAADASGRWRISGYGMC